MFLYSFQELRKLILLPAEILFLSGSLAKKVIAPKIIPGSPATIITVRHPLSDTIAPPIIKEIPIPIAIAVEKNPITAPRRSLETISDKSEIAEGKKNDCPIPTQMRQIAMNKKESAKPINKVAIDQMIAPIAIKMVLL